MASRVWFGPHWIGDTIAGAAAGGLITCANHAFLLPLLFGAQ
jgi:membrane-associated phospholipid phosphatase